MPTHRCSRWLIVAATFVCHAAFTGPQLWAESSKIYDQDSQVHLSHNVVEAKVLRRYQANGRDLMDCEVTDVHKGDFKKGQTAVILGADYYRKPAKDEIDARPLDPGDRVVLFLVQVKATDMLRIPLDAVIYTPLSGGMRLIQKNHVFSFSQRDITGAYVASVPRDPAKADLLTIERLRQQLKTSLHNTQKWVRLLEAKEDDFDVPALLTLLANRPSPMEADRDYFAERICMRFAATQDPVLLSKALSKAKNYYALSMVQRGFGTPEGRDYLLTKVNDGAEPMDVRLRYAVALGDAGAVYRETFTEIAANSTKMLGNVDEGNSGYLARIAEAALANAKHEALCLQLIRNLDYFGQGISQRKLPPLTADLSRANAILKKLYDQGPAQELQFAIEKATAWNPGDYAKLKSTSGDFISILRTADPEKYTKPERRSLIFEYECSTLLMSQETEVQPAVVLIHQGTKKEHLLPTQLRFRGWSGGGGSGVVELPEALPAGAYRVLFRLTDGDKVISNGHYFVAEL